MRKSKLELYEEILSALADRQLSVDNLAIQCNIDCATTTELVNFLEKNQLVENNHDYAKKRYSLTKTGEEVYKTLAKTKQINEMQKTLANFREDKLTLPSLAEMRKLVRTRLLARSRSRH
jgi:predicted transcriptional regulator